MFPTPWRPWAALIAVLLLAACASSPPATDLAAEEDPARGPTATATPAAEAQVSPTATRLPPSPTATDAPPTATAEPEPTATPTDLPPPTPAYPDLTTLNVVASLNEWRLEQGLWPLRINDTLTSMAHEHADYLLTLPSLLANGDIHIGRQGESPPQRAVQLYGWPTYSNADQIAVGEIAYAGAGLDAALGFWRTSDIHARTVVSPGFREIGVAVKPYAGGSLFIVVFGSQPGVLPALYDPASGLLYMSSERFRWSAGGEWIHEVSLVQVIDPPDGEVDSGRWLSWLLAAPPPASGSPPFRVAYNDGTRQITVPVDPASDIAWLPRNLSVAEAGGAPPVAPAAAASPAQPATAAPTATPPPTAVAAATTPPPTATTPPPASPATATSTPPGRSGTAPGRGGQRSVTVVYDEHSLSIVNTSPGRVDISRLEFRGSGVWLPVSRWAGSWLKTPLTDFPNGSCVQTWAMDEGDPGLPAGCSLLQSAMYQSPEYLFWKDGDFEVAWNGVPVATCEVGAGRCEVPLP